MARKSFRKRVVRKIKRILRMDEAQNVIEREFTDSHNNKVKIQLDFNPHQINEPTLQWQRDYGDKK